jgi:tryptophan halogenase
MIDNIVVVGGGTSGWLTVCNLLFRIHESKNINITLVESPDVPIIGVGESVTGRMYDVINFWNPIRNEKEFLKETGSTYKYGIKHIDWYKKDDSFISPIGSDFKNDTTYPTEDYDYIRTYHVAENLKYEAPLQNQLMLQNKLYPLGVHNYDVAYHIDAFKTSQYLRKKCLETGRVKRIEATIDDVILNEQGGVQSLVLDNEKTINGDLFFDCSGWSKVLNKKLDTKFISYRDNLLVNKAFVFPKPLTDKDTIKNYTQITARDFGWTFEIQLQNRVGRGYVFNDDMISVDKAVDEMSKAFGEDIQPKKVLGFDCGRIDKFWNKNVISIGLSSQFVEPMEATALHTIITAMSRFMEYYFKPSLNLFDTNLQKQYNDYMGGYLDDMRDFITFHYITPRNDTEFWKESSNPKRWSDELKSKMEIWKYRMPRKTDYTHKGIYYGIDNSLWLQVGMGMNIFDSNIAKEELNYFNLYNKAQNDLIDIKEKASNIVSKLQTTNEFYKSL